MHALIEARIQNLIARAESEGDYIGWSEDWTEGGAPEGGIYVSESWDSNYGWGRNRKPAPNTLAILESLIREHTDADVAWSESTIECGRCNKLIDTDDYYKRTFHVWDGDVSCRTCVVDDEASEYIDDCSDRGQQIEFYEIDLEDHGWTCCESDRYSEAARYDESNERAERVRKARKGYRTVIDSDGNLWITRD